MVPILFRMVSYLLHSLANAFLRYDVSVVYEDEWSQFMVNFHTWYVAISKGYENLVVV